MREAITHKATQISKKISGLLEDAKGLEKKFNELPNKMDELFKRPGDGETSSKKVSPKEEDSK